MKSNSKTLFVVSFKKHEDNSGLMNVVDELRTNIYNQKQFTDKFNEFCKKSTDGDFIEYWQQDEIYFYKSMIFVENVKGTLKEIMKDGHYRKFNFLTC